MNLGDYEFLRRLDDRIDEILKTQRRHERLLIGIIDLMAEEDADKAKAKELAAQVRKATADLQAAIPSPP